MKREIRLSLGAVIAFALSINVAVAQPDINLSLNLRYNYPGDTSLGGAWDLMAATNDPFGICALSVVLDNINRSSIMYNPAIDGLPVISQQSGTITEFVWGYNPGAPAGVGKFADVGNGLGTPGNVVKDDLYPTAPNSYDNMAWIASGTFGAVRPSFATFPGSGGGSTDGAVWLDAAMTQASSVVPTIVLGGGDGVRGDSITNADDTMLPGDVDRDGTVTNADLLVILNGFFSNVSGWDNGDVNGNDGFIGNADLLDVLNNFFASAPAPAITAVPEPMGAILLGTAVALMGAYRLRFA